MLARLGQRSHKLVLPYLVECLGQDVSEIKAGSSPVMPPWVTELVRNNSSRAGQAGNKALSATTA